MPTKSETAIDPICGMTVKTATAIQAVKEGTTYYFCCPKCKERFLSGGAKIEPTLVTLSMPSKANAKLLPVLTELAPAEPACCGATNAPAAHSCCGAGAAHDVIPSANSAYFCPMCPGEESNAPGYCGTCGMVLERNPNFHDPAADEAERRAESRFRIKVLTAMILATAVFLLAMLPMVGVPLDRLWSPSLSTWLQCALTTIVMCIAWPYWQSGFGALKNHSANMFTLIGLGAWSAYLLSLLYLLVPHWFPHSLQHAEHVPVYFESAAVIVALVMLGQWLEGSARKKTGSDLERLVTMLPKSAHRLQGENIEDVEPLDLKLNDRILIKPGEAIPADSILEEGTSEVDESLLTGESLPVTKVVGDRLIAGTVNHVAVLKGRVVATGQQSILAQIIQRVGNAQRSRAPIQDTVDRVTAYFVPAVVTVALLAAVGWWWLGPDPKGVYAFLAALSVLVIACPCALGLATPMSIIVGVGRAAREGYLVRDAKVFQKLATVNTIVFDKTGTLTEGKPQVVSCRLQPGHERTLALRYALALEQASEHPIAQAIAKFARAEIKASPTDIFAVANREILAGAGTQGIIEGKRIAIGKEAWLRSRLPTTAWPSDQAATPNHQEASQSWLAVDDQVVACFELIDAPRETAVRSIQQLAALGMDLYLLSGDRASAVEALAQRIGVKQYRSEVSPEMKRDEIKALKDSGKRVAMVGDGVNDAPALATADVGIAMASGTDLAQQASDITVLEGDLRRIVAAVQLSRQVVQNIQQNLMLGLMYNVVAIPIAAGALYPWTGWTLSPMLAAAAMAASSLSVVGNALRLRLQR
ncbi:MAG: heavy metal translocating P-type ATPase [Planctomycetaceae bacterium]|nr:heavy metal translocating P-type ATPase [Planctomycetaceae bacterium]